MQAFRPRKTPARERKQRAKRSPPKPPAKPARKGDSFAQRSAEARAQRKRTVKLNRAFFLGGHLKGKATRRFLPFQDRFSALCSFEGHITLRNKFQREQLIVEFLKTVFGRELKQFMSGELNARCQNMDPVQLKAELNKWELALEKALCSAGPGFAARTTDYLNPKLRRGWGPGARQISQRRLTELEMAVRAEYAIRWLKANFGSLLKRK